MDIFGGGAIILPTTPIFANNCHSDPYQRGDKRANWVNLNQSSDFPYLVKGTIHRVKRHMTQIATHTGAVQTYLDIFLWETYHKAIGM